MYLELKEKHSAYYWLADLFLSSSFVHVEEGFPDHSLSLPTVSIEWEAIDEEVGSFELGNKDGLRQIRYSFDVFTLDKNQRDEFIFRIYNELNNGINVYDYDEGFPPDISPTRLGRLIPLRKVARNLPMLPQLSKELYYRATMTVTMVYDQF